MEDDEKHSVKSISGRGSSVRTGKVLGGEASKHDDAHSVQKKSRDDDLFSLASREDSWSGRSKSSKSQINKDDRKSNEQEKAKHEDLETTAPTTVQTHQNSTPEEPKKEKEPEKAHQIHKTAKVDDDGVGIFRVTNAEVYPLHDYHQPAQPSKQIAYVNEEMENKSASSKANGRKSKHREHPPPPPSSVEDELYEEESLELENEEMNSYEGEDALSYLGYESREEAFDDDEEEEVVVAKSRASLLKEKWDKISANLMKTFNCPSRVFKLRGYHSEPDLSLPFEDKFDAMVDPPATDGVGYLRKLGEKFVSCEDIAHFSGKEHPDLVRGVLSEVKLRSYAIDENMMNSWKELYEWERKRYSFFDELFEMGYVVDSLEVLSQPAPKGPDGKPVTTGEYFVEADERHYRKKVDYGRVVFKTKHVYTGNFQDWYFQGPGRYCWQDGTVYQGEFSNGLMHGPGSIHWPDGCIYEGHFIYGKRTGWGVYSSADGQNTYAGEWLNGLPHGHGKMWYDPEDDDNDYYEGQWQRGLPQGVGTRQYATGDRYVGNWLEGMRNGYGIMIWLQERQVYKGEWLDGLPHGHGKHIWYLERSPGNSFPTRHVYQGAWLMGRREGIGKMVYPCGSVYEGRWKNGQRHGKGMFINPAGDMLVGLFRAGSILGGSDVPLHAPTYECDYVGLTEWLTAKFKLPLREDDLEAENLLEITKQYLPYLRKLYNRAGQYSQKYGKHGLYPAYMKKTSSPTDSKQNVSTLDHDYVHHHHPREYSRLDEPEHMKGKVEKPESLDGVNPVTRFGLWLLLRDCDNILEEVTMSYYDKIWCETPPVSFQTRHNPFEPVYLWQFLQALIVASVAYFIDIPRLRQHAAEKTETVLEPAAVSETTLNSGISFAEHRRTILARQQRAGTQQKDADKMTSENDQPTGSGNKKSSHRKGKSKDDKPEKRHKKRDGDHQKELEGAAGDGLPKNKLSNVDNPLDNSGTGEILNGKRKSDAGTIRKSIKTGKDGKESTSSKSKGSKGSQGKPKIKKKSLVKKSLLPEMPTSTDRSFSNNGDVEGEMEVEDFNFEEDDLEDEAEEGEGEEEENEEEEGNPDEYSEFRRKSVLFKKGEGEDPEYASQANYSISECFEAFLSKKLLPCLRREPGANLPITPQPLPALVDMYDAFKGIKQRDIIKGKEFLRSALPHLIFPNAKDSLWWHRCPEPLSHQVNIDELLEMLREKFDSVENDFVPEENFEEKFESEYLGNQAQNSEITMRLLRLCKENPNASECPAGVTSVGVTHPIMPIVDSEELLQDLKDSESEDLTPLVDFITEGNPFGADELVPEPFLWADDYKCIPVRRKYQHFENISTQDVFDVIHQLYPSLCKGTHEKDLQFEFIFCDWLWCVSLLAKISTEREFREAFKIQPDTHPMTNPQSLGVFAHYVKQIKNNPYLSPKPPPGFQPKRKPKSEPEEKKGVTFI